jgi:type 1 glutamine amidotransferase
MFLTHPPIQEFRVEIKAPESPLTKGLGASFDVEDEPYFIELTDPANTQILLTADYGPGATGATQGLYEKDTSLQSDGKSRVLGYTRKVGQGGVTYYAFGHCHNPAIRAARANQNPADKTPPTFRGPWENDAVNTLLRNAIVWGTAG